MKLNNYCWVCAAVLLNTAQAGEGDVIISRDVQPRVATVNPIVPDPNPRLINPGNITSSVTGELGDRDFAGISSGLALPRRLLDGHLGTQLPGPSHQVFSVMGPGHSSRTRGNGISEQVNRSVQQGLRPLQHLGGR
ncbi:hypothetical protein ACJRW5_12940 [Pseudomonas sp. SH1-B]